MPITPKRGSFLHADSQSAGNLPSAPRSPSPTWRSFLHDVLTDTLATDAFILPTAPFRIGYILVVLGSEIGCACLYGRMFVKGLERLPRTFSLRPLGTRLSWGFAKAGARHSWNGSPLLGPRLAVKLLAALSPEAKAPGYKFVLGVPWRGHQSRLSRCRTLVRIIANGCTLGQALPSVQILPRYKQTHRAVRPAEGTSRPTAST
jgi:hypothetical protein